MLETRTLSSAVPILSVSLKSGFNPPSYITPEKNQPAPAKTTKIKIILKTLLKKIKRKYVAQFHAPH